MVQSIAVQTFRNNQDIKQAQQQFERRLIALSKAHDTLTQERWQGANLAKIVGDAVLPYRNQDVDRFEIKGPYVWLPPKHSLALAMRLHELCTNAVKYGAMSKESGRFKVEWTLADTDAARELQIQWIENWRASSYPSPAPGVWLAPYRARSQARCLLHDRGAVGEP